MNFLTTPTRNSTLYRCLTLEEIKFFLIHFLNFIQTFFNEIFPLDDLEGKKKKLEIDDRV